MPHATSEQPLTNGDKLSSQFVHHLASYPVVNDSIKAVQQNPYGKKSIELADGAYQRFGKPVQPYLETPYSYAKPYVQKADEIADSGLSHVEHRFPIVKEETHTIVDNVKSLVWWPYSYATDTWQGQYHQSCSTHIHVMLLTMPTDEYSKTAKSKNRGDGLPLPTLVLAYISFNLRVASDFLHTVANTVGPKYEESKKKGADYVREAQNQAEHYKKVGQEKVDEYTKFGQQKAEEAKKQGEETVDEAKKQGEETKEQAKSKANVSSIITYCSFDHTNVQDRAPRRKPRRRPTSRTIGCHHKPDASCYCCC